MSQDSSYKATGWEIATGTGNLYNEKGEGNPLVFLLIIIPIILVVLAFLNKPFTVLRIVSIAGLGAKIIFMIVAYQKISSDDYGGALVLTPYNWFVLAIYAGLIIFIQYCIKQGE